MVNLLELSVFENLVGDNRLVIDFGVAGPLDFVNNLVKVVEKGH